MKGKKDSGMISCCWGARHELVGLFLLILATLLTLFTGNGLGIFAMFVVGAVLVCHKCWFWHCHTDAHCHSMEEPSVMPLIQKKPKAVRKPRAKKIKV